MSERPPPDYKCTKCGFSPNHCRCHIAAMTKPANKRYHVGFFDTIICNAGDNYPFDSSGMKREGYNICESDNGEHAGFIFDKELSGSICNALNQHHPGMVSISRECAEMAKQAMVSKTESLKQYKQFNASFNVEDTGISRMLNELQSALKE